MVWLLLLLNRSLELTFYNTSWRPGNQLRNQMIRSVFHFSHYFFCTLHVARGSPSAGSHVNSQLILPVTQPLLPSVPLAL